LKSDEIYLRHIVDATRKIEAYVSVGRDTFMAESHWQDAVVRQLEIIGEATKHISLELRGRHPEVPWHALPGYAIFSSITTWRSTCKQCRRSPKVACLA
jgi:uncharacterized protein with HEPN domain